MDTVLKIAIQKSGRLSEKSLNMLKECGIGFSSGINKLKAEANNFPVEVLFLRDDDIPMYVADGVADIGFVGENVVLEKAKNVEVVKRLGFGKCRLAIALKKGVKYSGPKDLEGLNIATSYPKILSGFLKKEKVNADIHEISGSVEIAPSIGLAEAVCDLVSSGSTLFLNGLEEKQVILKSEAVVISNKELSEGKKQILEKVIFRMNALQEAKDNKYILLNAPNKNLDKIISILPGMKSPTVLPLAIEGWSSVHSVVNENDFWEIIESLKRNGAEGILVVPIEKMIV